MILCEARSFPRSPSSIAEVRSWLRELLHDRSNEDTCNDLVLLGSELATNAVLHGRGEIDIRVGLEDEVLRLEVSDSSPLGLDDLQSTTGRSLMNGGRGLAIVATIATSWGLTRREDREGKSVWATLRCETPADFPARSDSLPH
jgi:anti-sigma regulatory factor (Ser/Thr protein kinase)